jgi:hypothetical protein
MLELENRFCPERVLVLFTYIFSSLDRSSNKLKIVEN